MFNSAFLLGLGERALKSAAQGFLYGTGLSVMVNGVGDGTGIAFVDVPWLLGAQTAVVLAVLSVVTSIGNANFTAGQGGHIPAELPPQPKRAEVDAADREGVLAIGYQDDDTV